MIDSFGDIALGSKAGSIIIAGDSQDYETNRTPSPEALSVTTPEPWSNWGANNLMPQEIANDIENCGVLAAALDAKARIGTGKGMQPFMLKNISSDGKEELEWVSDREIHDWLELNESFEFAYDSSFDKHAYGWNCGSYILNLGRNKITKAKRHDVYEARLEKKQPSGIINSLYLSPDWAGASTIYETKKQKRIDLLTEGNELADLENRIANNSSKIEFAFVNRTVRNGRHYYPIPLYRSNKAWIKIARSVPALKIAMYKNQITLKYLVIIHPKFWEDKVGQVAWNKYLADEKKKFQEEYYDKIDVWLSGEEKSYKSLFTGGFMDIATGKFTPYVEVKEISDTMKDGKHLPDSGAANSEILFALMINPALMGAGNPGGNAYGDTSGGSNVRESFLVQLMIMEAERRLNASVFNVVKNFNGWSKRIEGADGINGRLVFRYPSGLLTTLDTGKSTKPENL